MALTAQPQTHSNWGRWPQQLPQDFSMMESQGFLPYDNRTSSNTQIQRPLHTQYVVETSYQPAPPYQGQHAFSYMPYQSPPPSTPISPSYKHDAPRMMSEAENNRLSTSYRRDSKPSLKYQPRSPMSRSASVSSAVSKAHIPSPIVNAKTITYNETINPADQVNFETEVDELMKAIQRKQQQKNGHSKIQQTLTPVQTPKSDPMEAHSPISTSASTSTSTGPSPSEGKTKKKKWVCDGPSCNKSFVQKTHLDIHRRTHTGARPYVCNKDNCGLTFSQRGNLKTHMRRHTGEKPYACSICGKLFAQRGNVRSHEETHKGLKPFICRLDDCNKTFSQLGNMKTHQNNFHKDTLQKLTSKFVQFLDDGDVPVAHQELFEYFQEHYKNSNKGIKGRGKARTVAVRKPKGSAAAAAAASTTSAAAPTSTSTSSTGSPTPMAHSTPSISSITSSSPVTSHFPQSGLHNHHSQPMMHGSGRVNSYDMGHAHSHPHLHPHPHTQPQSQSQPQSHTQTHPHSHPHNHAHARVGSVHQRDHSGAYGMFEQQQQQQQQQHHQAAPHGSIMYEDHSRQMGFAPRPY